MMLNSSIVARIVALLMLLANLAAPSMAEGRHSLRAVAGNDVPNVEQRSLKGGKSSKEAKKGKTGKNQKKKTAKKAKKGNSSSDSSSDDESPDSPDEPEPTRSPTT